MYYLLIGIDVAVVRVRLLQPSVRRRDGRQWLGQRVQRNGPSQQRGLFVLWHLLRHRIHRTGNHQDVNQPESCCRFVLLFLIGILIDVLLVEFPNRETVKRKRVERALQPSDVYLRHGVSK